jgi:hypothetical protein
MWPPTVRDAAAGHLQALLETHRNLRHLQEGAAALLHQQVRAAHRPCCQLHGPPPPACRTHPGTATRPAPDLHLSCSSQLADQPIMDPPALDRQSATSGVQMQARRRHGVHGHDAGVAAATGSKHWG